MSRRVSLSLLITTLISLFFILTSCDSQNVELPKQPVEQTRRTISSGEIIGFIDQGTYAWLGIPYASAPVGDLRWRAPKLPQAWQGVRETLAFQGYCPQIGGIGISAPAELEGETVGTEDCLFLNVWAPKATIDKHDSEPLPVMVWIHGGGNVVGTANTYGFARELAAKQNVIVVTINYRLGLLGWFRHPALRGAALSATDDQAAENSGNFGTLDIIQSLRWVKENIAALGGDKNNVTLFGESAGGFNIYSLMVSPLAKGLFHKAISQSGGMKLVTADESENYSDDISAGHPNSGQQVALSLLANSGEVSGRAEAKQWLLSHSNKDIAAWLRNQPSEKLYAQFEDGEHAMGLINVPNIIRDGYVLPDLSAKEMYQQPWLFHAVPLMAGTNRDEMRLFLMGDTHYVKKWFGVIPRLLDKAEFLRMAGYLSSIWRIEGAEFPASVLSAKRNAAPVYTYRFDFDQLNDNWLVSLSTLLGAAHGLEISYVFGLSSLPVGAFDIFSEETLGYRAQLAHAMSSYWANFARTGGPGRGSSGDLPLWRAWSAAENEPKALLFDASNRGGIRQITQSMTIESLKAEIQADAFLKNNPAALCNTYTKVFLASLTGQSYFDAQEYADLGAEGCAAFPIEP